MYLVLEIQKMSDSQVLHLDSVHNTLAEAEQKYHTILAAAAVSSVKKHSAVMISDDGLYIKSESYQHESEG